MGWKGGIDEAGYGALLGPLVHGGAACPAGTDLAGLFASAGLPLADSKAVYRGGKGLARMEAAVLFAARLSGWTGGDLFSLLRRLLGPEAPRAVAAFEAVGAAAPPLPLFGAAGLPSPPRDAPSLSLFARFTFPHEFNLLLSSMNKSALAMARLFGVLARMVYSLGDGGEVVVDKQGGRNRYLPFLAERFAPEFVFVLAEGAAESAYVVGDRLTLVFRPEAESSSPLTALASMTAKYLRECYMSFFNRHWTARIPGTAPTAGYPADARRFFEALRPFIERESLQHTDVLRLK